MSKPNPAKIDKPSAEFTEQFARSLAIGQFPVEDILRAYGVESDVFSLLQNDATFQETVSRYAKDFQDNGVTAKAKAAIAVELLIPTIFRMAGDERVDAKDRKGCFDSLVEIAGFKKAAQQEPLPTGPQIGQLAIIINNTVAKAEEVVRNVSPLQIDVGKRK